MSDQTQGNPDGGDFSQADIDALLNGGGDVGGESAPAPQASENAEPEGDFSQADIDALLNGGSEPAAADSAPAASGDVEPEGDFSQSDIDALLNGAGGDAAAPEPAPAAAPEPDSRVDSEGRPFDAAAAAMAAAIEEEKASAPPPAATVSTEPLEMPTFDEGGTDAGTQPVDMLRDVELNVRIELGRTRLDVEDVLRLGEGSVVELDKLAGDPVDVFVNDRLVARGEVLVLNDNFCVRVSDIISEEGERITNDRFC